MKTDKLLKAFSRQNELESEVATVRKDQKSALDNANKLESDVYMNFAIYNVGYQYYDYGFLTIVTVKPCCTEVC